MENLEQTVGLINSTNKFIEANTVETSIEEIKNSHIIPVFTKSNEPFISHSDFIEVVQDVASQVFANEKMFMPNIRISHPIKGRIPEAKNKAAKDLEEYEKTIYYERMAFMIEIPTINDSIGNHPLCLTIGGVKAYNLDNYNSSRKDQHFKIFIGFKNSVCTNLCINTDGFKSDISVKTIPELKLQVRQLFEEYNAHNHLNSIKNLKRYELTEDVFCYFVGRLKMYSCLQEDYKRFIPDLRLTESQLNSMVTAYYSDPDFCKELNGSITLWNLYNNITGALKSSYIDTYLNKLANSETFMLNMKSAIDGNQVPHLWYLK